ncbi:MAG: selenocysteine-specific translation elongation factor SelB [Acidobacteriaceae bacterium]|nr:selenocysteine-specific translation elongation factor SelB [Acidobacteriaceae bacterium]
MPPIAKSVIVGTAGHVDHGKTSLVKALTGIDADRLEEEKRRGITIDIGFANLELLSEAGDQNFRLGFVDVPGHERFVRNMLAGIGGIDFVLLVIAADEGIKPQTREHFEICRLLNIRRGITVLTKTDAVDAETLEVVRMEVEEFVRGSFLDATHSPIVAVSAATNDGLEQLKREMARTAQQITAKKTDSIFRLPIDRVFAMKGFGSVVTGTLVSGSVQPEDEVEVLGAATPQKLRVRGVQVHNQPAVQAVAGERTALNLAGVSKDELSRGMTLVAPGNFRSTTRADVQIELLEDAKPLRDRARVHFHSYTSETVAEVVLHKGRQIYPGHTAFARLRFADPVLLLPDDRFILRQFSPVVTIGGGIALDSFPLKKAAPAGLEEFLQAMTSGSPADKLLARVSRRQQNGISLSDAVAETGWPRTVVESTASQLIADKRLLRVAEILLAPESFQIAKSAAIETVTAFHAANPLVAGISREELREKLGVMQAVFAAVLDALTTEKKIQISGEQVRLAGRSVVMKDEEAEARQTIENAFSSAGLKVPALKEVIAGLPLDKTRAQKLVTLLLRDRVLVKLSDDLVFHSAALESLRKTMRDYKSKSNRIDVAKFKDMTGISRKYAIPLLEFLDREHITRREGDMRVIL